MKSYGNVRGRIHREVQREAVNAGPREASMMCPMCGAMMPASYFEVPGGPCAACLAKRKAPKAPEKPQKAPEAPKQAEKAPEATKQPQKPQKQPQKPQKRVEVKEEPATVGDDGRVYRSRLLQTVGESGLCDRDFARATGLADGYIANVRAGSCNPSARVVRAVCRRWGLSADWLLGLEDGR